MPAWATRAVRLARRNPAVVVGGALVLAIVLVAILAPVLAPYDPSAQQSGQELRPPDAVHPLGTDDLGRDVLSRILFGSRASLIVGVAAVALGALAGVPAGAAAGFYGGWVEEVVMRASDTLQAFPAILVALAVVAVAGAGLESSAVALGIVTLPQFARIVRAAVLVERGREYVQAARAVGCPGRRVLARHVLPNCIGPILVQLSLAMGFAVLLEAGLSFLGVGIQPPEPSWGGMLSDSRPYLRPAPWYGVFPGVALALLMVGLNYLTDGLRDAFDPRRTSSLS